MTNAASADHYIGLRAVDQHGTTIGSVGRIHLAETTGRPSWVTVTTGLLGTRHNLIPLRGSWIDGGDLVLPFDKGVLKGSPQIADTNDLDRDEEQSLYDYYLGILTTSAISSNAYGVTTNSNESLAFGSERWKSLTSRLTKHCYATASGLMTSHPKRVAGVSHRAR